MLPKFDDGCFEERFMTRMAHGQDSQEHGEHESHMTNSEVDETTAAKQRKSIVAIPILPRPFAIFCLVANIVIPGTGNVNDGSTNQLQNIYCFVKKTQKF